MASKACPSCGLINAGSATRCDCGYDFTSGQMKDSYLNYESRSAAMKIVPGERLATSGNRLSNYVIDTILQVALLFIVVTLFPSIVIRGGSFGLILFPMIYYVFFEAVFQKTPGKFLTKTKVVMDDGSKPPIGAILVRTLCRYIPFEPLSIKQDTWWHDRLSETRVVRDRK